VEDIVCDTCGYPDWWVDNDCVDCGCVSINLDDERVAT
jgi:hypothetical protein